MPMARVRGTELHYEIKGTGTPLVLTAGQGTGAQARARLIEGLARDHAVLTYDQRGTGRSERVAQGQPIEELAEDIADLMDAVGFRQADVMGLSTGTGMATALAVRHPERVVRLVLGAPWTHGDPDLRVLQDTRKAAARALPPDAYSRFNSILLYPPEYRREHFEHFERMAHAALASPQDAAGIAARLDAIVAFDARPLYAHVRCPTLVLGARDDLVMPTWFAEDAARAIPGARLVILDGGGHMFPETRTDEFLAGVLPFLA